jgi:LacI family transcriptional regulator
MAGKLAAEHLLNIGHERIACITGPLTISLCRERLKGFRETLENCGIPLPAEMVFEGDFVFESGIRAAESFFSGTEVPSAIWGMNDVMIYGARKYLYDNDVRVPEDISLIGMDDLPFSHMINPSLTTVTQPFDQLAEKAVELIEEQQTGKPEDTTIVVEPGITVRNSTGKPGTRSI